VDSSVWIDFLGPTRSSESAWLAREIPKERIGLTDLILCEVLQGVRSDADFWQLSQELGKFQAFSVGGPDLAVASALNFRFLRAKGITVRKTIDCLIATFCIERGHALLHRDPDFDPFEQHLGLRVIHP
jgi:predicted nucleic acid-binding protein